METWDAIRARRNVRSYTETHPAGATSTASSRPGGCRRRRRTARSGTSSSSPTATSSQALSKVWQGAGHLAGSAATIVLVLPEPEAERYRVIDQYDLGQATMAMMLAATDLGIGSGHSAVGDQEACRGLLGVPERPHLRLHDRPRLPGRPSADPAPPADRRPFDDVVHRGHW